MVKRTIKLQKQTVRKNKPKSRVGVSKKKSEKQESEKPLLENKELLREFKELEQIAKQDSKYPEYKESDEYKTLRKVNPTIFYLQHIFQENTSIYSTNGTNFQKENDFLIKRVLLYLWYYYAFVLLNISFYIAVFVKFVA